MKYTENHMWLRVDGDEILVGLTEYAVTELGDISFVELPEVETRVSAGDEIAVVESEKAAVDIAAPIEGEIVEVNETLVDRPAFLNEDPQGEAWMFRIAPEDADPIAGFLDEDAYHDLVA